MKSHTLTAIMAAMLMCMAASATDAVVGVGSIGDVFTVDGLTYRVTEPNGTTRTVEVARCAIKTGSVTIPDGVTYTFTYMDYSFTKSYSVRSIGESAFEGCSGLTSITIPNSVKSIGNRAFLDCSGLTSVTIPNSVTSIGEGAFCNCSGLTSVTIGNSVTRIGFKAFAGCSGLTSITIPNSVTEISGFTGCTGLTSITLPESVRTIGSQAFLGCSGLTSVTIGNRVNSINNYAFKGCSGLTSVTIPNSVRTLGQAAFADCNGLTSVTIGNRVKSIGSSAFSNCTSLASIIIPNSVTSIDGFAFYKCNRLTSVTIGNSVTSIGHSAFRECSSLADVFCYAENVPVTINYEENGPDIIYTFYNSPITSATLYVPAASLESYRTTSPWSDFGTIVALDGNVDDDFNIIFADANVKAICVANWDTNHDGELSKKEASNVTGLGEVFKGNTSINSFNELQYFTGMTSIDNYAFENCTGLTSVIIPNGVTSIGSCAFRGCGSLISVSIPNSVTSLVGYAFAGCSSLAYIDIPESVTSISYSVFDGCSSLISVTIPNGVTSIECYTFRGCSSLTSITIPDSVTDIDYCAFDGCSNLTTVSIGSGVTNIGSYAFAGSTGLKDVHCYAENIPTTENNAFDGVNMTTSRLYVPASSKEAYKRTSPWSDFGMILAIGEIPATGISLNQTILSFNAANETATLIASVTPSNATNKSVTWTTSNSSVATVSDTGAVTSKANGTATITATTTDGSNLTASCEVIVSIPVLATGISLNQTTLSFNAVNQTATLTASVTPSNAANKNVIWTSSDASVATVNDTGLVTAKGNGAATITATTTDGSNLTATCNVTVYEATRINIAISYAGYSTFYDSHCNYILPNGLSAQVVTNVSNNKLIYKTIADGNNAGVVPMGTAVILVSDEKRSKAFTLTSTGNNASYSGANLLHGSDETTVTMGEGYHYKLSYGPTGTGWDKVFGWYWGAQDGSPFQIEGHKAWLVVANGGTRAEGFSIDGVATEIIGIASEEEERDIYYDMQGRRVSTPTRSGLYIKNDKKIIIK